jgi:type IV pilus biogenesis protein CpaD/CtpE
MAGDKKKSKFDFKEDVVKPWVKGAKAGTAALATLAIPTGRAAKVTAKIASRSAATKLESIGPKVKTKTFSQGSRAKIETTAPKRSGGGTSSPVKGSKVKVEYKTKGLSAKQQATLTTGRVTRENTKTAANMAKGAAAYAVTQKGLKKDKKKK